MSGLHTLPARSPVNASRTPLPKRAPDSGPVWWARPSLSETYTPSHSILKFFQVDKAGMRRMTSSARYFKEGVGSSRPN
jgi:hypothetical protein